MSNEFHKERYIKMLKADINYESCNGCNEKFFTKDDADKCSICRNEDTWIAEFNRISLNTNMTSLLNFKNEYHKKRYIDMLPNNCVYNSCCSCGEIWYAHNFKTYTREDSYGKLFTYFVCTLCDK